MSKSNHDFIRRFIFERRPVRGELIRLEQSFQTIVQQHAYPRPICKLLGEVLCIAGLLSSTIKFEGRLTVQFRGKGKLKLLLAQCDNHFHIRSLAKWEGDLSYDDLMMAFSEGVLAIMLDTGVRKNRYQGVVAWHGHSLAESIEEYFKNSEQLLTKIWLEVNETTAAGFMLQVVPLSASEKSGAETEIMNQSMEHITELTTQLNTQHLLSLDLPDLLHQLYPDEDIRIFSPKTVAFRCRCTQKSGENAILLLGRKEAEDELRENRVIKVTCDFCNKEYIFDAVDVANIFHNKDLPPSDINLH